MKFMALFQLAVSNGTVFLAPNCTDEFIMIILATGLFEWSSLLS